MSQLAVDDVANKSLAPLLVDKVVWVSHRCKVPPFSHKVIHSSIGLILQGYRMNVMTHGLEKKSPLLPLGIDVQSAYAMLSTGSNRVAVVLRDNTQDWIEIRKGTPVTRMVAANQVPHVIDTISAERPRVQPTLMEAERQTLLLDKLDLSGLEAWPKEQAEKAHSLLQEYHDIFSLEKHDLGHTTATKHKIVLKDPDTPTFKEHFHRIPPPQLDEVREHLKFMLDAGVVRLSNSPWHNTVVLVRKNDGSLHFCIDFQRLNALTIKDSHPLPCICETLESLAGAAHFSTFDLNLGFWQVPMDEESKQYMAFTLGSMGLYECESMSFGLCNAPPTFQRLMQNCLGELNLTYCLIYLDDVIVFSETPEEHLQRMHVVFDHLREHSLKLKPSKCDVFKSEINYLVHHMSQKGVCPSKKNLESIAQCPPLDTYTKVKSFVGLVGHYRYFIKGFAKIAAPLYDLTSGDNKDKKSEQVDLSPEAQNVKMQSGDDLWESFPHTLEIFEGAKRYISAFRAPLQELTTFEFTADPHSVGLLPPCYTSSHWEDASSGRLSDWPCWAQLVGLGHLGSRRGGRPTGAATQSEPWYGPPSGSPTPAARSGHRSRLLPLLLPPRAPVQVHGSLPTGSPCGMEPDHLADSWVWSGHLLWKHDHS